MPADRNAVHGWARAWAVSSGTADAVLEHAEQGPAFPPFTGLPPEARGELGRLPLGALAQLRELTDAEPASTRPPAGRTAGRAPTSPWAVLDAVEQAVCVADVRAPDAPLVYVNPAFTRTTGYSEREVLGRNCRFLHAGLDVAGADAELEALGSSGAEVAAAVQRIRELLAAGEGGDAVLVNRRADGGLFVNELALSPVNGPDGAPVHYVAVQRDVTPLAVARRTASLLEAELEETARAVQATLVPAALPELPGWELAAGYSPATRSDGGRGAVSGDFYDVFPGAGTTGAAGGSGGSAPSWVAAIGDVSGRGPRAAAATSALRWALRGAATTRSAPAALLTAVADAVHDALDDRFATLAVLALPQLPAPSAAPAAVRLALAGHPQPVLLPASGAPRLVGVPGTLVGPFADVEVAEVEVALAPGDQLVLYTDGVVEAFDPGGAQLGEEGLLAALAALPEAERRGPGAAARTAAAVGAAVAGHVGGGAVDDLTLLVVVRT
ncbi:SpoIIE family protein phosphatase [Quadrisphaera sp. INWT6]|uniref:PP2C family protein-serine/threonine phosphatase n=1 Tax=Quadrisphaera sp. INWT6 TaxID=2596917 RepID=UPI0018920C50|nr:SpoIIE family protein phosphatase [Quadrisphaera sp. INWT6]MBF5083030.1 SpoIIE family protein phosphatase [Quadrisphaera sp. INWT6]